MAPKLYTTALSPAGHSVLLTAEAINLKMEVIMIDPSKGEHLSPEFLKINPEHTFPTLDDNGFIIRESHVINTYLVQKYSKDDYLYPQNLQKRTLIDQCLYLDCGVIQPKMMAILEPIIKHSVKIIPKDKSDNLIQILSTLETTLQGKKYLTGNNVTIADLNIIATISACSVLVPVAANRFPNITEWITRMQSLPYYEQANGINFDIFVNFVKNKLMRS
ncbi:hypothetical protein ILUMI_04817 [Ignelater luminosus]|uniref:Glutathione S-transferase 1-like n=1 Tax=Ignelater luminosus TaxID=2038154 RepID=A0A8K0D8X4_IGNLU|nr:hypothetical protein ILUMI_04817 [Ignelater luminosus]